MNRDNQYKKDCVRLASLIEQYTDIPQERVYHFFLENTAEKLLPYANKICETDEQRKKLTALFEFKNQYETMKSLEKNQMYQLNCSDDAKEYFKNLLADVADKEQFIVAYLNVKNQIIKTETISTGTINQAPVFPREIIKEALFINASSIMLAHNHPSGNCTPSKEDIGISEMIKQGLEAVGMQLLDHIIVAGDKAISLVERGHILKGKDNPVAHKDLAALRENTGEYSRKTKDSSAEQQIKMAKQPFSCALITTSRQKKSYDRGR